MGPSIDQNVRMRTSKKRVKTTRICCHEGPQKQQIVSLQLIHTNKLIMVITKKKLLATIYQQKS